jgi:hypothetical protein
VRADEFCAVTEEPAQPDIFDNYREAKPIVRRRQLRSQTTLDANLLKKLIWVGAEDHQDLENRFVERYRSGVELYKLVKS